MSLQSWLARCEVDGSIYQEVDGFYVYSQHGAGCLNSHALRAMADYLDDKNKEWELELVEVLSK
jgi:hypothetical protein